MILYHLTSNKTPIVWLWRCLILVCFVHVHSPPPKKGGTTHHICSTKTPARNGWHFSSLPQFEASDASGKQREMPQSTMAGLVDSIWKRLFDGLDEWDEGFLNTELFWFFPQPFWRNFRLQKTKYWKADMTFYRFLLIKMYFWRNIVISGSIFLIMRQNFVVVVWVIHRKDLTMKCTLLLNDEWILYQICLDRHVIYESEKPWNFEKTIFGASRNVRSDYHGKER